MKTTILVMMLLSTLLFVSACATMEFGVGVGGGSYHEEDRGR